MTGKVKKDEYKLDPDSELRFQVSKNNKNVTLELKSGFAEIFGTELVKSKKYEFLPGSVIGVFTWQGCNFELHGNPDLIYIAKETPMPIYLNCHAALERLREISEKEDSRGPVTMVVGPCNVGKSTVSRILANYSLRMKRKPIYVNLDVAQVDFAVPGTFGALFLEKPASIEEGFSQEAPLVFHFGYSSPQCNDVLYKLIITRLAEVCNERLEQDLRIKYSGIIINSSSWMNGEGYKTLTHAAQAFEVDAIFVIDQERLYNDLLRDMPDFVKVVLLPKSGGVIQRTQSQRADVRNSSIYKYFFGTLRSPLHPHRIELKFEDVFIYKIGTTLMSSLSLRQDKKAVNKMTTLIPLRPSSHLTKHLLSVSFADSDKDDVVQTNVAGFLYVLEVNMERKRLTILSPQPELVPKSILLFSEITF